MEAAFKERLKYEIAGILLVALSFFLFLTLISYSPLDPSFFSYASSRIKGIHNWMGIVGAYISSLLFQGFGFPCFLIPFVIGVFAFNFIFRWEWKYLPLKWGGWLVILISTSAFLGLWLKPLSIYQQDLLVGGFIGEIFSRNLVRYFNKPGATILLLL
ncbi:MAG TPA: DNA translocase FtsK 4TM domain-containing protein, partial [Thermodesulfobacteriota bacterium]|nr:DNA translocase FtsK 4TM domain-containing protein [Thermodesulfobacteriota bacterium]